MSNPWTLDVRKLAVPNFFVELELIRFMTRRYHPKSLTIRTIEGNIMVDIIKEAIVSFFELNK